jgi:Leucine-rich repeat (LRR) protein
VTALGDSVKKPSTPAPHEHDSILHFAAVEDMFLAEAAAKMIQKMYRGKLARRAARKKAMERAAHDLAHEMEADVEAGMKDVKMFLMGTRAMKTKRPEKIPVRHVIKELVQARMWRGWVLFSLVFVLYMVVLQLRSDSVFGYATYSVYREAVASSAEERITGDWEEVQTLVELKTFVQFDFNKILGAMREVCPTCEVGITTRVADMTKLSLQDFLCSDFDTSAGSSEYPPRDCLDADAAWASAPTPNSAPCCRNTTLQEASLRMMARYQATGDLTAPLAELSDAAYVETRGEELDEFVSSQVLEGAIFQVVVSRGQRMLGIEYGVKQPAIEWFPQRLETSYAVWSQRFDLLDSWEPLFVALFAIFMILDFVHEVHENLFEAPSLLDVEQKGELDKKEAAKTAKKRDVLFWLFLEGPTFLLPIVGEITRAIGFFRVNNFNVFTAVIATLMMMRFFHEGQVVEAYRGFELAIKKSALALSRFVLISAVIISLMAYIHFSLFGPFTDLYNSYQEAVLVSFSTFATGTAFDGDSFEYQVNGKGYVLNYVLSVTLMYLILSQFFIAIIVSAYDAANQEEERHEKEMKLMPGFIELHPPLGRRMWRILVYFFTGYSLDYACFMPGVRLAETLDKLLEEQAAADRRFDGKLVPREEVSQMLDSCGFSPRTVDAVLDTYGQLPDFKDESKAKDKEGGQEGKDLDATLKQVLMALQNGQARMLTEQDVNSNQISELQSAVEILTQNLVLLSQRQRGPPADVAGSPAPDSAPSSPPRAGVRQRAALAPAQQDAIKEELRTAHAAWQFEHGSIMPPMEFFEPILGKVVGNWAREWLIYNFDVKVAAAHSILKEVGLAVEGENRLSHLSHAKAEPKPEIAEVAAARSIFKETGLVVEGENRLAHLSHAKAEPKPEAEAKPTSELAKAKAAKEAAAKLKAAMPFPFMLADPAVLVPAIEAAKAAGVDPKLVEEAELKLQASRDDAEKKKPKDSPAPKIAALIANKPEDSPVAPKVAEVKKPKDTASFQPPVQTGRLAPKEPPAAVLDLSGKGPGEVASMLESASAEVTELTLKGCQLKTLPESIGRLGKLARLDVSENELEALPAAIKGCALLTSLDASDNALKALPAELGELSSLKELLAYKNAISAVPEELGKLAQLETLNLFNNKLLKCQPKLGEMKALTEVNFAANKMMQVPPGAVAGWAEATVLNWADNRLLKLAPLGHMQKLQELRLFGNQLSEAPDFGRGMPALTLLDLRKNNLEELPENFFELLPKAKKVSLDNNCLKALPASVGGAKSLASFTLNSNQIETLPADLARLPLEVLFVSDNKLTRLPATFGQTRKMQRVNLSGNLIEGCDGVIEHLKQQCNAAGGAFWPPES